MNINDIVRTRSSTVRKVIYVSRFGKVLTVDLSADDELPDVHWHNSDGSIAVGDESDLDIIGLA